MRQLSTREKIIAGIVAVVLVIFLVNRFVLEPQCKELHRLREELASLNEQTASFGPKLVEFNRLKSDLIRRKQQLAAVEQALSQTVETAQIIHEVSKQARTRGLQIQQVRPQRRTVLRRRGGKQGEFYQLFLNLEIHGWYEQLGDFLGDLEQQPFYIKVAELHLERLKKSSALLEIQLKLQIVVRS